MDPLSYRHDPIIMSLNSLSDEDICPIALEPLKNIAEKNDLVLVPCCHQKFSKIALHEWLAINPTCPHCRKILTDDMMVEIIIRTHRIAHEALPQAKKSAHTPEVPRRHVMPKIKPQKAHKISKKEAHTEEKKLLKLEKELKEKARAHDKKHHHHHHHH